jgi:hypothetical protein
MPSKSTSLECQSPSEIMKEKVITILLTTIHNNILLSRMEKYCIPDEIDHNLKP